MPFGAVIVKSNVCVTANEPQTSNTTVEIIAYVSLSLTVINLVGDTCRMSSLYIGSRKISSR